MLRGEDRGDFGPCGEQMRPRLRSRFTRVAGRLAHEAAQSAMGHSALEAVTAERAGRCGQWACDMRDTLMPEIDQLSDRKTHSHHVLQLDERPPVRRCEALDQE